MLIAEQEKLFFKQIGLHDKYKAFYKTMQDIKDGRIDVQHQTVFAEDLSDFALHCLKGWKDEYDMVRKGCQLPEDHALFKHFALLHILRTVLPDVQAAILLQRTIENRTGTTGKVAQLAQNEQFRDWEAHKVKVADVRAYNPSREPL